VMQVELLVGGELMHGCARQLSQRSWGLRMEVEEQVRRIRELSSWPDGPPPPLLPADVTALVFRSSLDSESMPRTSDSVAPQASTPTPGAAGGLRRADDLLPSSEIPVPQPAVPQCDEQIP
jgi:hypothetical protein